MKNAFYANGAKERLKAMLEHCLRIRLKEKGFRDKVVDARNYFLMIPDTEIWDYIKEMLNEKEVSELEGKDSDI